MNRFTFILSFFFLFAFIFFLSTTSYAQQCEDYKQCTYSQDDGDITTKIKCYRGVCQNPNGCPGPNNNGFNDPQCRFANIPECSIGVEVPCPGPNPTARPGACAGVGCDCGDSEQACCEINGAPSCRGTTYATSRQDGVCICKDWSASASAAPKQVPCAQGQFKNGICEAIPTGLGFDIETTPAEFVRRVFSILLSLAGGIALVLIIMSGYKLMTSQGNPEAIQGARETITSAIVGLLFIIFSFLIFQVITTDILKIPFIGQ